MSIKYIKDKLKMKVGFSDHSLGKEASLIALAFGASVLEKHFTLDKKLKGPDQKTSLDPNELHEYIDTIRKYEKSLGGYYKKPYGAEKKKYKCNSKTYSCKKTDKKRRFF